MPNPTMCVHGFPLGCCAGCSLGVLPGNPGSDWTEEDEHAMHAKARWEAPRSGFGRHEVVFAREILRLRAERDREEQHHAAIRAENVKLRGEYADAIEAKFAELRSALLRSPSGTESAPLREAYSVKVSPKLIANKARCPQCLDVIESKHRHDLVHCSCGAVFVDGGLEYLRRGFTGIGYEELSEYAPPAPAPLVNPDVATTSVRSPEVEEAGEDND